MMDMMTMYCTIFFRGVFVLDYTTCFQPCMHLVANEERRHMILNLSESFAAFSQTGSRSADLSIYSDLNIPDDAFTLSTRYETLHLSAVHVWPESAHGRMTHSAQSFAWPTAAMSTSQVADLKRTSTTCMGSVKVGVYPSEREAKR